MTSFPPPPWMVSAFAAGYDIVVKDTDASGLYVQQTVWDQRDVRTSVRIRSQPEDREGARTRY
jgi:hypothetical protein